MEDVKNKVSIFKVRLQQDLKSLQTLITRHNTLIDHAQKLGIDFHLTTKTDDKSLDDVRLKLERKSTRLERLITNHLEKNYNSIIQQLDTLKFGQDDKEMTGYLGQYPQKINTSAEEYQRWIEELSPILKDLQSNENQAVREMIKNLDTNKSSWSSSNRAKARLIEGVMAKVPINERIKLLQSKHTTVTEVFKAMASHQNSFTLSNPIKNGKILVANSSTQFKKFKEQFQEQMNLRQDIESEPGRNTPGK